MSCHRFACVLSLWCMALASPARAADPDPRSDDFFELHVRPVLAGVCGECHTGDASGGELQTDSRANLLVGGERGPAVVPGKPGESLLIKAILYDDPQLQMPPDERLPEESIAALTAWIAAGSAWPDDAARAEDPPHEHWAFTPVQAPAVPANSTGWSEHPIDRFIAARRSAAGIEPVGDADRQVLVRRLYFDLLGLPPTLDELALAHDDTGPGAIERLVDRLLTSPHYGERWARHWMDVVRYADTAGDNADYPIPEARRYRDYIIDAFNDDLPFDTFVAEQIAGDLLARESPGKRYAEQIVATGFLALSRRYATGPYELFHLTIEDSIDTVGRAFLGLSLRCARCHDHKFDPVTSEDYYSLYGIFASTQYPYAGSEEFQSKGMNRQHFAPLALPAIAAERAEAHQQRLAQLTADIERLASEGPLAEQRAGLDEEIAALEAQQGESAGEERVPEVGERLASLKQQRGHVNERITTRQGELQAEIRRLQRRGLPEDLPGAYAVSEGEPKNVAVQLMGDPGNPGAVVERGLPEFLARNFPAEVPAAESGRRQLAAWLASPDNPLVARVIVNRIWQHRFGRGLAATPSNFGRRGAVPSHPELLDWLAQWFVEHGWSIKSLDRLIVTSRTYQLASTWNAAAAEIDPDNRLYWRHERRRLEAEVIRDAMLAVAGRLDRSPGREHPFPPIESWGWTQHQPFRAVYDTNRRSVYLMTQRIVRHPLLALFDGPDTNVSTPLRSDSIVPLQALYFMNNPQVHELAAACAQRLIAASDDPAHRVDRAYKLALSRASTSDEQQQMVAYVDTYRQALVDAGVAEDQIEPDTWTAACRVLLLSNEFLYID